MKLLRSGLVTAETQRDQVLLRLQALQAATSASTDPAMKEALTQDTEAAAAAADRPAGDTAAAAGAEGPGGSSTAPAVGLLAEVGVVPSLRARVAELETELRQVSMAPVWSAPHKRPAVLQPNCKPALCYWHGFSLKWFFVPV